MLPRDSAKRAESNDQESVRRHEHVRVDRVRVIRARLALTRDATNNLELATRPDANSYVVAA